MSFVPVTGPATFEATLPARDSVVVFTDDHRTVALPIRAALPVLTRAHQRDDAHPTVGLLAGAVLLAMRMVAAGKIEPDQRAGWQIAELDPDDQDRLERLVDARAPDQVDDPAGLVRSVMDAVADAMPRSGSVAGSAIARRDPGGRPNRPARSSRRVGSPGFADRLARRLARHTGGSDDDRPHLVTLSLRVEADEGELVGGCVRLVLQVHDERNPLHFADAALLWTESGPAATHGFGDRARTHASIALRAAADAWPVLDRLLELRVPDEITLDAVELADLLDNGLAALKARGVDVLWPRSLGRDLTAVTVLRPGSGKQGEPLVDGLFGPESLFSFSWQLALDGDPLTEDEMDAARRGHRPVVRLRDQWVVVDPAMARRAKRRLVRTAQAGPGAGRRPHRRGHRRGGRGAGRRRRHPGEGRASGSRPRPPATRCRCPPRCRRTLRDYQLRGLTWLDRMTSLGLGGCLADDMGLGKTITLIALHLHRRLATRPPRARRSSSARPRCWATGSARSTGSRRAPPCAASTAPPATSTDLADGEFVLTTYGTMRLDARSAGRGRLGPGRRRRGPARQEPATPRPPRRCARIAARARVALTGTPVENNLSELWAILDWTTPGLLGSLHAFRARYARADRGRRRRRARPSGSPRWCGPFLLRRRKSDPGIAPELPPKTETDHAVGADPEQAGLYEAVVRETMARDRRTPTGIARRGLVLKLLTALKQICNHPAQYLQGGPARGCAAAPGSSSCSTSCSTRSSPRAAPCWSSPSTSQMARLLEQHLAAAASRTQFLHGGTPVARARGDGATASRPVRCRSSCCR